MLKIIRMFILTVLTPLLISCVTVSDENRQKNIEPGSLDLILCEEPRPQICTREYDPVCATMYDGSNLTGSTACTSCSNPEVKGYQSGACHDTTPKVGHYEG